jgi:hypothetical protein
VHEIMTQRNQMQKTSCDELDIKPPPERPAPRPVYPGRRRTLMYPWSRRLPSHRSLLLARCWGSARVPAPSASPRSPGGLPLLCGHRAGGGGSIYSGALGGN